MNHPQTHNLNCAMLIGDGQPCSCGATQVHNHGPEEGRGVRCPETVLADGRRVGACLNVAERAGMGSPVDSETGAGISGEVRTVSSTGGQKGVKEARFDLIPPEALEQIAIHYGRGAEKYEVHNWRKGFEWSKSYASLQRHAHAFWAGQDLDPETGTPHMAAVAFHAMTLLVFMQEQRGFDDRYSVIRSTHSRQPARRHHEQGTRQAQHGQG